MEDIQIRTFPWSGEVTQVSGLMQKLLEISKEIKSFLRSKLYLRFADDPKGNKKSFCYNSKSKRLKTGNVVFFLNGANDLAMETDEVWHPEPVLPQAYHQGFTSRFSVLRIDGGEPETGEDQVRDYMENLTHKHSWDQQSCIQAVEGAVWFHCNTALLALKYGGDRSLHNHQSIFQWLLKNSPKGNC